jgi:thiol-disulfide isomerase/thioredoxin
MTLLSRTSATLAELEARLAEPASADALVWEAKLDSLAAEVTSLSPSVRKLDANAKETDPSKRLYNAETSAKVVSLSQRFEALNTALAERRQLASAAANKERAARTAEEARRQAAEEAQREAERLAALEARREQEERDARAAADKAEAAATARKKAEESAAAAAAEAAARKKAEDGAAAAAAAARAASDADSKRVLDAAIARGLDQRRAQRQQQQVPASPAAPVAAVAAASAHRGGAVLELTGGSAELRQLLSAHPGGVIVDWSAPWCGPCRMMAPHFAAASAQWPSVLFVSINTEATPQNVALTREASISAYPTFQAYQNSSRIDEWRGADLAKLRAVAAQLASSAGGAAPPVPVVAPQAARASDPDAMAQRIAAALGTLRGATNLEELKAAVRALLTFVGNVVAHPSEARYRRVRIANAAFSTSLGSKPGGLDAMLAFGFEQQSEGGEQVLVMPEAAAHDPALRQVKTMLESALRAAGGDVSQPPPQAQAPPSLFASSQGGGAGAPPFPDFMAAMLGASGSGAGGNLNALAAALASNPMARAGAATMASNPDAVAAMLQQPQARAMMAQMHPELARMLDDPATVAQLVRMAAPAMSSLLASGSSGPLPGAPQFPSQPQQAATAAAAAPPPTGGAAPMTDEEMLQEAIRRSLEDIGGPP